MKKRLLAGLMAGLMAVGMTACGSPAADTEAQGGTEAAGGGASAEALNIQVVVNTLASEYWSYVAAGAEAYGEENSDVTVKVVGPPSETGYDEQMNMIETAISSAQYDGMVISPLQADTVAEKIAGVEIPIIAVNTKIDAPEVGTFVGTGNQLAAAQGGAAAVEAAKAAGWETVNAICMAGTQGDPTGQERYDGFKQGIEEAGGTFLEDETQYADWVADKAVACMESIMQTHPEGVAIICANNDDMAIAAARAAQGNAAYENTIFCGFDGNKSACQSILEGGETMSVAQDAYGMGYKAVDACVRAIRGEEMEEFIDTGCEIVTVDTAQARLDTLEGYAA